MMRRVEEEMEKEEGGGKRRMNRWMRRMWASKMTRGLWDAFSESLGMSLGGFLEASWAV